MDAFLFAVVMIGLLVSMALIATTPRKIGNLQAELDYQREHAGRFFVELQSAKDERDGALRRLAHIKDVA